MSSQVDIKLTFIFKVLRSSDEHGLCYIDTQNLDGEQNLKQREVPRGFVERVSGNAESMQEVSKK